MATSSSFNSLSNMAATMQNGRDICQASSQLRVRKQGAPTGHSETQARHRETQWDKKFGLRKKFSPSGLSAPPALRGRRRHVLGPNPFGTNRCGLRTPCSQPVSRSGGEEFPYLIETFQSNGAFTRDRGANVGNWSGRGRWTCRPLLGHASPTLTLSLHGRALGGGPPEYGGRGPGPGTAAAPMLPDQTERGLDLG